MSEQLIFLFLNNIAILAAFFIASAAKQGKLSLVADLTKALSEWSPGVAAAHVIASTVEALRKGDLPQKKESGQVEEEEGGIQITGPGQFP